MPRRKAEIEEWTQRIDAKMLEDLIMYPSQIPAFYTTNIIQRALAHLVAYTEDDDPIRVRATEEGLLKVSAYPAVYEDYDVFEGTAMDDYDPTTTYEFDKSYNRFDIFLEGGDVFISFKKANDVWGKDIPLPEGYHSIDFSGKGIKIKNKEAGVSVRYYIIVYR